MSKKQMMEIKKELKKIALQTSTITNDFWIDSLKEVKGHLITEELINGLAKISKETLQKEIAKKL